MVGTLDNNLYISLRRGVIFEICLRFLLCFVAYTCLYLQVTKGFHSQLNVAPGDP